MREAGDVDDVPDLILWLRSHDVGLLGQDNNDHGLDRGLGPEAWSLCTDLALVRPGGVQAQVCQYHLLL